MKKHKLLAAIGTLALAANFILPSLAFGANQQGTVDVSCPTTGGVALAAPGDVTFSSVESSTTQTSSTFDGAVLNGTGLPPANILVFGDTRSNGIDGCPVGSAGWTVTVVSTNLTASGLGAGFPIPASSLRIITSKVFATPPANALCNVDGDEVCYSGVPVGPGNAHDVDAPFLYDDENRLTSVVNNNFLTATNYQKPCGLNEVDCTGTSFVNGLGAPRTILSSPTAMNSELTTGAVIMIDNGIAISQPPDSYTGTITYTANAL